MSHIRRALFAVTSIASLAAFAPAQAATLQILDPDGACSAWISGGTTVNATLTCVKAAPSAPGAPSCSLSASPNTLSAAGTVTLTATCTNTDSNTTWAWSGAGVVATPSAGASPRSTTASVSATGTYSVVATNGTGSSPAASTGVTIAPSGGGGGGGGGSVGGAIQCGTAKTIVMDMDYISGNESIKESGRFGNGEVVVVRFRTPDNLVGGGVGSVLRVIEYASGTTKRMASLSQTACDFEPSPLRLVGFYPTFFFDSLLPGTTYYVNIKNADGQNKPTCATSDCQIRVKLNAQ